MVGSPSVVVGISTRDRAAILSKAIESAFAQSHRPLRVAVVDDASKDETPTLRGHYPEASWTRFETCQGHVRARNLMMLGAPEDYYVSLDDDAWFLENDEIALAVDYLEKHAAVAAVAYDILTPDQTHKRQRGRATAVATFIGCGHVLRLSAVKKLGGYAELPSPYGAEEKDLCLQLIDAGYDIVRLEGVHVWHDKTPLERDIPRQHRSGVCNDLSLALRRTPWAMLVPVLTWKTVRQLAFAVQHSLLRSSLQGFADFFRSVPEVWRHRRPVRAATLARYRSLSARQGSTLLASNDGTGHGG